MSPAIEFHTHPLRGRLFKPVRTEPLTARADIVRRGTRIVLVDATVLQSGEVRARASAVYVPQTEDPPGETWHSLDPLPTCPEFEGAEARATVVSTGGRKWTTDLGSANNSERKSIWQVFDGLVDDEAPTPFQRAAVIAETTSLVCNWGSAGQGFINVDTTLSLTCLPVGEGLGLRADGQISSDGIAVGVATLFDRTGAVGKCAVLAISNARRQHRLA